MAEPYELDASVSLNARAPPTKEFSFCASLLGESRIFSPIEGGRGAKSDSLIPVHS